LFQSRIKKGKAIDKIAVPSNAYVAEKGEAV